MTTTIQIRHVPEELHRALKTRATQRGMTLSDYLLAEIEQVATKPTLGEDQRPALGGKHQHAPLLPIPNGGGFILAQDLVATVAEGDNSLAVVGQAERAYQRLRPVVLQ